MLKIIPVISRSPHYVPALIYAARLNELWDAEQTTCVESWMGPPHDHWFDISASGEKSAFVAAYASIDDEPFVGFTGGMHRTRWLIQSGELAIPLNIPPEEQETWAMRGLLAAPIGTPIFLDLLRLGVR